MIKSDNKDTSYHLHNDDSEQALPWEINAAQFGKLVQEIVACDSAVLGVFSVSGGSAPRDDEVLAVWGFKPNQLANLLSIPFTKYRLVKEALPQSASRSTAQQRGTLPLDAQHVLHVMCPQCLRQKQYWHLILTRKRRAFCDAEMQAALVQLRQWQCQFLQK